MPTAPPVPPARVRCTAYVAAPPQAVFNFLANAPEFPRHMPNVLSVTVSRSEDGRRLSRWSTLLDGAPLGWLEEDVLEPPRRLSYRLIEGDIEYLEGEWLVEAAPGGGSLVTALLSYRLGVPIIEEALGDIVTAKVRLNLEAMLEAARRALEGA